MREIVLDTETTGLDPAEGHRIVEIGAVELFNHMKTGRTFHVYVDPERSMPPDAFRIHGLGDDFLRGKPRFAQIARDFIDFIAVDRLVIHNAAFDLAMINAEFGRLGIPRLPHDRALDTVQLARQRFPGAQASLDALCKRFGIDLSVREKHGALLDCELLAEVYLELLGGRQHGLGLDTAGPGGRAPGRTGTTRGGTAATGAGGGAAPQPRARPRPDPLPPRLTAEEDAAHRAFVEELGGAPLWRRSG